MLEIEKKVNEFGNNYIITTNEGKFGIFFAGNLDLYWKNLYQGNIEKQPSSKSFTIIKENYFLYSLFNELYNNIKECNIYQNDGFSLSRCETIKDLNDLKDDIKERNKYLKKLCEFNPERLFKNGTIEWHSDDFEYDDASVIKIEKSAERFIVTISKSKKKDIYLTYSIRFRNIGSRYSPFNICFMDMYNKLNNYDQSYHQIHIEEYMYQKKLVKNSNLK